MWAMPYAYLGPEGTFSEAALRAVGRPAPSRCPAPPSRPRSTRCATARPSGPWSRSRARSRAWSPRPSTTWHRRRPGHPGGDCCCPIAFALLARPGTALGDIKRVGGHPHAQPQCRRWLAANLPDAEWLPLASNAEAARQAADGQSWTRALAGAFAARPVRPCRARPRRARPGQRRDPVRRGRAGRGRCPRGPARTARRWPLFLAEDHPGALLEILTEFAVRGVNLTTIQSRPTGDGLGQLLLLHRLRGPRRRRAGRARR